MNREIRFRGIDVRDNKFIYGYYFKSEDKEYITMPYIETKYADYIIKSGTSSQYTGLKDKNDVEIYEGDIIKFKTVHQGKVEWNNARLCYCVFYSDCGLCVFKLDDDKLEVEVIGNIYENEDLLK